MQKQRLDSSAINLGSSFLSIKNLRQGNQIGGEVHVHAYSWCQYETSIYNQVL